MGVFRQAPDAILCDISAAALSVKGSRCGSATLRRGTAGPLRSMPADLGLNPAGGPVEHSVLADGGFVQEPDGHFPLRATTRQHGATFFSKVNIAAEADLDNKHDQPTIIYAVPREVISTDSSRAWSRISLQRLRASAADTDMVMYQWYVSAPENRAT